MIAVAALLWGGSATLGKLVFQGNLAPNRPGQPALGVVILAQTRTGMALLVLVPFLLARYGSRMFALPKAEILRCMAVGTIGIAASNFFYYYSIEKTTVATAIIVQYTAPVWVLVYMIARGFQHASVQRVFAVALAVAGAIVAIGALRFTAVQPFLLLSGLKLHLFGVLAAFGASFSFSFYNIGAGSLIARHHRWSVFTYALLGAVIFWLLVNPPWKIMAAHYSGSQWRFMFVFSITSMLLPFSFYFAGLQYLDATRAIVTSCLEPVFAILFASTFAGEAIGWPQILGMIAVLAGTIVIQLPEDNMRLNRRPAGSLD